MGLDLRRTPADDAAPRTARGGGPALPARAREVAPDAGGPILVTCDGVEVTQAIQDMAHSVPLVAGKRTIARVYLSVGGASPITLSGIMRVRKVGSSGLGTMVRAQAAVTIDTGLNGNVRAKRESETRSLNFILPREVLTAGAWEVRLSSLHRTVPNQTIAVPAGASRAVSFVASPPLRVRVVGIRYQSGGQAVAPSALDFTLIRSWLGRAYPVPSVEWSQVVVDGPDDWPFQAPATNAFIRGLRTTDVAGGLDARTHYYGLVADNHGTNFMRGLASGIPTTADPTTVASGPTGGSDFGWDHDGSYGDWYTGHELGHTFGRFHAEFCGAGGGAPYPFANGQLSNADGAFVGFDVGDIANGLPPKAMPGTTCHDVMSYCVNQWISSFTYGGIRTRLVGEDGRAGAPLAARRAPARQSSARGGTMPPKAGTIHVVATLNVTGGTGEIRHVTPQPAAVAATAPQATRRAARSARGGTAAGPSVSVRVYGKNDRLLGDHPAPFIPDSCLDPGDDTTGAIDTFVAGGAAATRLELVLDGTVVDTFTPAPAPAAVTNIRGRAPAAGPRGAARGAVRGAVAGTAADDDGADPVLTWTAVGTRGARGARGAARAGAARGGAAPAAEAAGGDTRYTVQVSVDGGTTWQTVGFALKEPQVRIDRSVLGDAASVKVRVTATSGFTSVTSEKTMKASNL